MSGRITDDQRKAVLELLAEGHDRHTIAEMVGISPGQVSAVCAHVTMGTYELPDIRGRRRIGSRQSDAIAERSTQRRSRKRDGDSHEQPHVAPVLLGPDTETNEQVFWNPDPLSGSVNPHVLILGESGFGKTYTISCLLAELAQRGIHSMVFDYGQGFALDAAPSEFVKWARPVEIYASRDGIDINPLQIFPTDILGPVNVAQRVADTFGRVYTKIGVQQHAVLRQAVLDAMAAEGIVHDDPRSWSRDLPAFESIQHRLQAMAANPLNTQSNVAATVASHISTMFVFNTFRPTGLPLAWGEMLASKNCVFSLQLKGLEYSLERAVTEFLLWNLIGFIESMGPSPLQCFVVLDEAHRLSFDRGSPVEKLLREGRKFGLGLILASQQPEDFSQVAFSNTATKLVFQVADEKSAVSRQLCRKVTNAHSFSDIYQIITRLPRGTAYLITENLGRIVQIAPWTKRHFRVR